MTDFPQGEDARLLELLFRAIRAPSILTDGTTVLNGSNTGLEIAGPQGQLLCVSLVQLLEGSPASGDHRPSAERDGGWCVLTKERPCFVGGRPLFVEAISTGEFFRDAEPLWILRIDRRLLPRDGSYVTRWRNEVAIVAVAEEHRLTKQEARVALLMARRLTNAEIARLLHISPHTVRTHVEHALYKLGVPSRHDVLHALATHK